MDRLRNLIRSWLKKEPLPEKKFYAMFGFRLTEAGRRYCKLHGLATRSEQVMTVCVTADETYLFHLDADGYLVGSSYCGATTGYRRLPRFAFLKEDIAFDKPPDDWREILHYKENSLPGPLTKHSAHGKMELV